MDLGFLHGNGKTFELLLPDALQKGCHANLGCSMGGLPKVQLAGTLPIVDLSRNGWLGKTVVVECDYVD